MGEGSKVFLAADGVCGSRNSYYVPRCVLIGLEFKVRREV